MAVAAAATTSRPSSIAIGRCAARAFGFAAAASAGVARISSRTGETSSRCVRSVNQSESAYMAISTAQISSERRAGS